MENENDIRPEVKPTPSKEELILINMGKPPDSKPWQYKKTEDCSIELLRERSEALMEIVEAYRDGIEYKETCNMIGALLTCYEYEEETNKSPSKELYSLKPLKWTSEVSLTETIRAEGPAGVYIIWKRSSDGYSAFIPSFKFKDDKIFHFKTIEEAKSRVENDFNERTKQHLIKES